MALKRSQIGHSSIICVFMIWATFFTNNANIDVVKLVNFYWKSYIFTNFHYLKQYFFHARKTFLDTLKSIHFSFMTLLIIFQDIDNLSQHQGRCGKVWQTLWQNIYFEQNLGNLEINFVRLCYIFISFKPIDVSFICVFIISIISFTSNIAKANVVKLVYFYSKTHICTNFHYLKDSRNRRLGPKAHTL